MGVGYVSTWGHIPGQTPILLPISREPQPWPVPYYSHCAGCCAVFKRLSNSLVLLMDRVNFPPAETSIFTFNPYVINEGSSAYWIYGEDGGNDYHFTYEAGREYLLMSKDQSCPGFKEDDVMTWCDARAKSISGDNG